MQSLRVLKIYGIVSEHTCSEEAGVALSENDSI